MTWHVDERDARLYVDDDLDGTSCASIEAHVEAFGRCRELIASVAPPDALLDDVWAGIVETLDRPRRGPLERGLTTAGLPEGTARLVAATSRARLAYLVAVAFTVVVAIAAARADSAGSVDLFLLAAPIGPLAATALSFGRWSDPAHAVLFTTPTSALKILLVRTTAAVVPAIVLTGLASLWIADHGWIAAAWLLPGLALCLGALALSSWWPIEMAAIVLAGAWIAVPVSLAAGPGDLLDALTGSVQVVSAVVVAVGVVLIVARRTEFEAAES